MAVLKNLIFAAALIVGSTSLAAAQGPATGGESPVAGGAGGAGTAPSGTMNSPPAEQGSVPSPAAQSGQKDVSPASPDASTKQEK
jgi:hypothetical protein